jgi:LuxR family maltose regulon positive regulatory protein
MTETRPQLIADKITVPDEQARLQRSRLIESLHESLGSCAATIINGRAGTGKTTLAADLARHVRRAVSWYKVDAADGDLRLFCEYLSTTVARQRMSLNIDRLLQLTETVESDRAELLAEAFVFELSEGKYEPLLIVVEDLHLVYDADWVVPFFRRLLPLLPTDVHLLITCRSMPPAPLWRLRSKQMLRVLDEAELAFTLDEAAQLFKRCELSEEYARIAMPLTNGRAVAIAQFAATCAGSAVAESFLSIKDSRSKCADPTPNFQT